MLRKSELFDKAVEGEGLKFHPNSCDFSNSESFKNNFIHYGEIKAYHKDQFKEWVIKNLDFYEKRGK